MDTYERRCARRETEQWVRDWATALELLAEIRQDHPDTFNRVTHLSLNPFSSADHFDWTAQTRGQTTIALQSSVVVQHIRELVASWPLEKLCYRDTEGPLNIVDQEKLYPTVDGQRKSIGRHCCAGRRIYPAASRLFTIELSNPACRIYYHAYPNRSYRWRIPVGRSVDIILSTTSAVGLDTIITMLRRCMQDRNHVLRRTGAMNNVATSASDTSATQLEPRWTFDVRIHTPSTATTTVGSAQSNLSTYLDENVRFERSLTDTDGERKIIIIHPRQSYSGVEYSSPQLKADRVVLVDSSLDYGGAEGRREE